MWKFAKIIREILKSGWLTCLLSSACTFAAAKDFTNTASITPPLPLETSRDFYNAGAKKIREGKFNDAEPLLQSAMTKQDERVQPAAIYDLGYVQIGRAHV